MFTYLGQKWEPGESWSGDTGKCLLQAEEMPMGICMSGKTMMK